MKNATTAVIALDILAIAITIGLQFPRSEKPDIIETDEIIVVEEETEE